MTTEGGVADASLAGLHKLAEAYKAGDKALRREVGKALRDAVRPISGDVIHGGAQQFPSRGGLRARIAAARPGSALSLGGQSPKVSLTLRVREGYALKPIDDTGFVRHPVYQHDGRKPTWVKQDIHAKGAFTDEFERQGPEARARVQRAITAALEMIARKA